jgi:hypothetical protein
MASYTNKQQMAIKARRADTSAYILSRTSMNRPAHMSCCGIITLSDYSNNAKPLDFERVKEFCRMGLIDPTYIRQLYPSPKPKWVWMESPSEEIIKEFKPLHLHDSVYLFDAMKLAKAAVKLEEPEGTK